MAKKFSRSSFFSSDIGIDLGTGNTLVYVRGRGIVINEPSAVAVNEKTGQVVAVGHGAKEMIGKTPPHIRAVRPLSHGVISDFEVTQELLTYLIHKAQAGSAKLFGPRVVVGVPTGVTNVESRAVRDAALTAGAREVYIVEEPMAGAIGCKLPVQDAIGTMVLDIGAGTTDIAVHALGGTVSSKSTQVAGDRFNDNIIDFVRSEFSLAIGERTAEETKIHIGAVLPLQEELTRSIRGRDLATGLPREIMLNDSHVREALSASLDSLMESMKEVIENTPPELLADVLERGVTVFGGGALLRGLPELLSRMLGVPVHVADEPLTAVVRGTGIITENPRAWDDVFMHEQAFYRKRSLASRLFSGARGFALAVCLLILAVLIFIRFVFPGAFSMIVTPLWRAGSFLSQSSGIARVTESREELQESRDQLQQKTAGLMAQNAALTAQVADLTRLLGSRVGPPEAIVASVLARPPVAPYDVLVIDQGSRAGVVAGALAMGAGGTPIGIVGEVEGSRSRVTLYSSRTMRTDGWVGANRIPVTIIGEGAGTFTATISRDAGAAVGDGVYVAANGAFPIGTVTNIEENPSSPTVQLDVRPYANPFSTTWVTVSR